MSAKRILIYGTGAIGGLFGALLSAKYPVTFFVRKPYAHLFLREGLIITGKTELRTTPKICTELNTQLLDNCKYIFISVKSYDTLNVMNEIKNYLNEEHILISLQNGLGNTDIMVKKLRENGFKEPENHVLACITSYGVTKEAPNRLYHTGIGETVIGSLSVSANIYAEEVQLYLQSCGIDAKLTDNIIGFMWVKCAVNCALNPLTALLRIKNGVVLERPELLNIIKEITTEINLVASKMNIILPVPDIYSKIIEIAQQTRDNKSSMLQDIENGRKTEIDFLNGAIVKYAELVGVDVPVNRLLWRLLH